RSTCRTGISWPGAPKAARPIIELLRNPTARGVSIGYARRAELEATSFRAVSTRRHRDVGPVRARAALPGLLADLALVLGVDPPRSVLVAVRILPLDALRTVLAPLRPRALPQAARERSLLEERSVRMP